MSTTRKMIDFKSLWLLAACVLPLCLAVPANPAARADDLLLPVISSIVDPPEIILPKPPPAFQGATAMEQAA
jgi:hypothetical protein